MSSPLSRYACFMETLRPETVEGLQEIVCEHVHFKDPFNDVIGSQAMQAIFIHMFETLDHARFHVHAHGMLGETGILHWSFESELRQKPWTFEGMSRIEFGATGRVSSHIDHWDAARDFYEHFPIIGHMLRGARKRIAAASVL